MAATTPGIRPALPAPPQGGLEKAAILLLTLGPDAAAEIFKHLGEAEVRALSEAMARVRTIPRLHAAAVHEEAWRWLSSREGFLVDGEDYVRKLIETVAKSRSGAEQQGLREFARRHDGAFAALAGRLEAVPAQAVARVVADEQPQVVALVLANLAARQAADVLALLGEEVQVDVVRRIAELRAVPEEVLVDVGTTIMGQVERLGASGQPPAAANVGGAKLAADIMNLIGKAIEGRVMGALDEQAPDIAETIRNLMLTFEDLQQLDNRSMQLLLKEIARDDLMLAMKTASQTMQDKILTNMSQRAREIMLEDISTMGPVRLKDVEKAQANIIAVVRRLAEEQKIQIGVGSGDDALV
jgi:flagellar motor switch protein FliG